MVPEQAHEAKEAPETPTAAPDDDADTAINLADDDVIKPSPWRPDSTTVLDGGGDIEKHDVTAKRHRPMSRR